MDGIIVINKEKGCTSHDIVYKIRKMFNTKVGHTGTLDPNATGVLPILLGKGTKISKYLIEHDKEYEVVLQLGVKTTTADEEGEIIEEKEVLKESLEQLKIERILKSFIGKIEQMPPKYSAIKVNGRKLYEYARKGQEVEIKPREVEIYNIEITNIQKEKKQIEFKVSCSKGTYIRTLCEDIAEKMRTVGYMKELKRTKVGDFNIVEFKVSPNAKSTSTGETVSLYARTMGGIESISYKFVAKDAAGVETVIQDFSENNTTYNWRNTELKDFDLYKYNEELISKWLS